MHIGQGIAARPRGRLLALALAAGLFAAAAGCAGGPLGNRMVRTPVFQEGGIRVFLREHRRGGETQALGFDHPRTISSIRLSRILVGIDVREQVRKDKKSDLKAAVAPHLAGAIGEGMSRALQAANPDQEIVVMAVETRRRHNLFTADYLTSLVAWVTDDHLWIEFGDVDTRLSGDPSEKPREPVRGAGSGRFRVVKTPGIRPAGPHTVVAAWTHPAFSKAAPRRTKAGGREHRRTVLMEEAAAADDTPGGLETALSPAALRELADLEEERLAGTISEDEYQRRRREILQGE